MAGVLASAPAPTGRARTPKATITTQPARGLLSGGLTAASVVGLQRSAGNRAVGRLLQRAGAGAVARQPADVFPPPAPVCEPAPVEEHYSEDCTRHLGSCEFYRCRQRNTGNPRAAGYYLDYGHKYCERFSTRTRPRLSHPGRHWLDKTLLCLQEFIHRNVPGDASPEDVKRAAFDSHPYCYVESGLCFLSPDEWGEIMATIDSRDNDLKQMLVSAVFCGGNYLPMLFPMHSLAVGGGYRGLMERDRQRTFGRGGVRPFEVAERRRRARDE
jgi:hypothetical protein